MAMGRDTADGKYHVIVTMEGCGELILDEVSLDSTDERDEVGCKLLKFTVYAYDPDAEEEDED